MLTLIYIQADKLQTLTKAAGFTEIEPIWYSLYAKALEGQDLKELVWNVGAPAAGAAAGAAGAAAAGGEEAKEEEKKEEEKEESDEDMGFGNVFHATVFIIFIHSSWIQVSLTKRVFYKTPSIIYSPHDNACVYKVINKEDSLVHTHILYYIGSI